MWQIPEATEHVGGEGGERRKRVRGEKVHSQKKMLISIPPTTKSAGNIFLLDLAKKESVPNSPHKMALNNILSLSHRWEEQRSCKEPLKIYKLSSPQKPFLSANLAKKKKL